MLPKPIVGFVVHHTPLKTDTIDNAQYEATK